MVEDGKISAEEGVKLLQALGEDKKEQPQTNNTPTTTALSEKVDWQNSQEQRRTYKQSSGTSIFTDFFESAIQKIRDLDLDFNFGSHVEIDHIFQHRGFYGQRINLSLENGSITILPWNENDVRLQCVAKVYRASNQDEARQVFFRETNFDINGDELKFYSKVKSIKLDVTCHIPVKMYDKIKLYTFNGHIKSENVLSERFEAKVVNGSIATANVNHSKLSLETVNGKIEVRGGKANDCELKTVNGAINISGQFADCDVETMNGAVNYVVEHIGERQYADLKAMTGSITVDVSKELAVEGKLKTNVGGFSCDLTNFELIEDKKDFMQKSLKFSANQNAHSVLKLTAETNTGSISVTEMK